MTFKFANMAMKIARLSNLILIMLMISCFIYNEISIITIGYYNIAIHNASIYFILFNTCIILFRVMMSWIQTGYDFLWICHAISEFLIGVFFAFVALVVLYLLLLPIDGIRNKILGTLLFNISISISYLRSDTLHSWKDM